VDVSVSFEKLYLRFGTAEIIRGTPPLLAHYTTVATLEQILSKEEFWFSNPLFMNDLNEMRFGIVEGMNLFMTSNEIEAAAGSPERAQILREAFQSYYRNLENEDAIDTYVFCLSEHKPDDYDGRLSMWRAYGGQGNGAALVLNIEPLKAQNAHVPLLLSKVVYATHNKQRELLTVLLHDWIEVLKEINPPDQSLYIAAYNAFILIKYFALTTKHVAFEEELEWRILYTPETDVLGELKDSLSYNIGIRGVEPKLKFKITPLEGLNLPNMSLATFLDRIILGPTVSQPLAVKSIERMISRLGKPQFVEKVHPSSIPFRPV
jgi:hypothetical protein